MRVFMHVRIARRAPVSFPPSDPRLSYTCAQELGLPRELLEAAQAGLLDDKGLDELVCVCLSICHY